MSAAKDGGGADGDDTLLDQWSFLDTMIERQAASLRAGAQDPEEDEAAVIVPTATSVELAGLHTRVTELEGDRNRLRADLEKAAKALSAATGAAAANGSELERVRGELAQERAARELAETKGSDLVRALRQARDETERAVNARTVADAALAAMSAAAAVTAESAGAGPSATPAIGDAAAPTAGTPRPSSTPAAATADVAAGIHRRVEHPGFDVFDPPKEPPMRTRYEDGPPARSSAELLRPAHPGDDAARVPPARGVMAFIDRLFGRR